MTGANTFAHDLSSEHAVRRAARTWTASWTTIDVPRRLSPAGTTTAPDQREVWSRTDDEAETVVLT